MPDYCTGNPATGRHCCYLGRLENEDPDYIGSEPSADVCPNLLEGDARSVKADELLSRYGINNGSAERAIRDLVTTTFVCAVAVEVQARHLDDYGTLPDRRALVTGWPAPSRVCLPSSPSWPHCFPTCCAGPTNWIAHGTCGKICSRGWNEC